MKKKRRRIALFLITTYILLAALPYIPRASVSEAEYTAPWTDACVDQAALVTAGDESLDVRLSLIGSAADHIRIATYMLRPDKTGRMIMGALYQAAERGVQVELLLDGTIGLINSGLAAPFFTLGTHPNIRIRLYNILNLLRPDLINACYHEKYLIIDDRYLLTGGRNSTDEFLDPYQESYSLDLDILVEKIADGYSLIDQARERFDTSFSSEYCKTAFNIKPFFIESEDLPAPSSAKSLPDSIRFYPVTRGVLLGSGLTPGWKEDLILPQMAELMVQAQEQVIVCSPYFVCDDTIQNVLARVSAQSSRMMIITNSAETGNNIIASADGVFHRGAINALDAEVMEVHHEYSLHSKCILIDQRISIVGSYNMDMRSAYIDTEQMIALESPGLSEQLQAYLETLMASSVGANEQAHNSGLAAGTAQPMDWVKALRIYLLSPVITLFRYLV